MPVQLILDDEGSILVPVDDCTQEAWMLQFERAAQADAIDSFRERLGQCFAQSLVECLDPDLKPPTEAQLKYATVIARELGLALPSEVLRFRGPMTQFIQRYADVRQQRRRNNLSIDPS